MGTDASKFQAWLNAPLSRTSRDPRFEVRRATTDDFEQIFDLVDSVFPRKRPRAAYDWLYRRNPGGLPMCWLVIERESGQLVANTSRFPWPVASGSQRIEAAMGGDSAVSPRLQRQGLFQINSEVRESHPWENASIVLSCLNPKSRGALAKMGRENIILGPLPSATLLLHSAHYLRWHSWPEGVARLVGGGVDFVFRSWQKGTLAAPDAIRVEQVGNFDSSIDELTAGQVPASRYWCPRDPAFLNWRYFQNPLSESIGLVALEDEHTCGYSVIRTDGRHATVMEFFVPRGRSPVAAALLRATIDTARQAGCSRINIYATSGWDFWRLFRRAGFLPRKSDVYRGARCPERPDVSQEENWQLLPGDSDVG